MLFKNTVIEQPQFPFSFFFSSLLVRKETKLKSGNSAAGWGTHVYKECTLKRAKRDEIREEKRRCKITPVNRGEKPKTIDQIPDEMSVAY